MSQATAFSASILVGSKTDPGRSGKNNEDAFDIFAAEWQNGARSIQALVAVVADGIGGHNAGEMASRIAVEKIRDFVQRQPGIPILQRLEQAVLVANQEIYNTSLNNPNLHGMGTTVVAAAIVNSSLFVVHAGDSRAYLIRNGLALRLTVDHTWAQEAIDGGYLTPEAARVHPNRNVIKRYVGVEESIAVDRQVIDIDQPHAADPLSTGRPMAESVLLHPGDTILLCSDGLTDELTDQQVQDVVGRAGTPQNAAEQLVARANAHGGRDNITVALLTVPGGIQPSAAHAQGIIPRAAILAGAGLLIVALIAVIIGLLATRPKSNSEPPPAAMAVASASPLAPAPTPVPPLPSATQPAVSVPSPTTYVQVTEVPAQGEGATPTIRPTSTPVATYTPTRRPPTRRPTPRPTATSASAAGTLTDNTSIARSLRVTLLEPAEGAAGGGFRPFRWSTNMLPPAGYGFELVLWRPDQDAVRDGFGLATPTRDLSLNIDLAALDADPNHPLDPGVYRWGLLLVRTGTTYQRLRLVSDSRLFTFYRVSPLPAPTQEPTPEPPTTEPPTSEPAP